MATTFLEVKNNAVSTLAADITDAATSLTVASGEGSKFPSAYPFHISIDDEILSCTNRSSDVLTVVRAQQSTSNVEHSSGTTVALNITAKSVSDLNTAVNSIENVIVGSDVRTATIDYTDGDNAMTIADGGGVTFAQAVDLGSNTLTTTGSLQVRTIDYSDGDLAMTIADGGGVTFPQDATFSGGLEQSGGAVAFNQGSGDYDFKIESDGTDNIFHVDGGVTAVKAR